MKVPLILLRAVITIIKRSLQTCTLTQEAVKIKITLLTANKQCAGKGKQSSGSLLKQLCSHILRYCQKQSSQGLSGKERERWPEFDGRPKIHQNKSTNLYHNFKLPHWKGAQTVFREKVLNNNKTPCLQISLQFNSQQIWVSSSTMGGKLWQQIFKKDAMMCTFSAA